ncbi:MAG: helix-turn-helix transcriptional regulator [Acidibacillus sp.]|nr:helix-turn-helix transcriptional regulator [Acidibacillus sp.]
MDNELGRKIRILRHKRDLTQQEIAYRTGISTEVLMISIHCFGGVVHF